MAEEVVVIKLEEEQSQGYRQPARPSAGGGATGGAAGGAGDVYDAGGGGGGRSSDGAGNVSGDDGGEPDGGKSGNLNRVMRSIFSRRVPGGAGMMDMLSGGGGGGGNMLAGLGTGANAAILGPVAAVVAGMAIVDEAVDSLADGMRKASAVTAEFVRGNYFAPLRDAAGKIGDTIKWFGLTGFAASQLTKIFLGAVDSAKMLTEAFVQRARQLSEVSGGIATAFVRSDISQMRQDIKEANALGPNLVRLIEQQDRFARAFDDATLPIKEAVLQILVDFLQPLTEIARGIADNKEAMAEVWEAVKGIYDGAQALSPIVTFLRGNVVILQSLIAWAAERIGKHGVEDPGELIDGMFKLSITDAAYIRDGWNMKNSRPPQPNPMFP